MCVAFKPESRAGPAIVIITWQRRDAASLGNTMPSTFAWLDTSAEEQRKIRELVALFTEKETLDALGIGQIRDVFSNAMFPGLSVIQTRARYLLLVPWSFIAAARSTGRGTLRARACLPKIWVDGRDC